MHQGGFIVRDFQGVGGRGGGLTKGDFAGRGGGLPRGDFPVNNSLNGDPPLNMWE